MGRVLNNIWEEETREEEEERWRREAALQAELAREEARIAKLPPGEQGPERDKMLRRLGLVADGPAEVEEERKLHSPIIIWEAEAAAVEQFKMGKQLNAKGCKMFIQNPSYTHTEVNAIIYKYADEEPKVLDATMTALLQTQLANKKDAGGDWWWYKSGAEADIDYKLSGTWKIPDAAAPDEVTIAGATGVKAVLVNGTYDLVPSEQEQGDDPLSRARRRRDLDRSPVYRRKTKSAKGTVVWLYRASDKRWEVSDTKSKDTRKASGWAHTANPVEDGTLPHQFPPRGWNIADGEGGWETQASVVVSVPWKAEEDVAVLLFRKKKRQRVRRERHREREKWFFLSLGRGTSIW